MPPSPPPSNNPDPDPSIVFGKFAGLTNTVTPERLDANELWKAENVDLDDRGMLHRRRGYTQRISGKAHSLFTAANGEVYAVIDNELVIIRQDFSTHLVRSDMGPHPLAYVQVGDTIYFSSPSDSGKIIDGVVSPWGADVDHMWLSPVVPPTPTLAAIRGRVLGQPPAATVLAYFNGRIYLANGRQVWATDLYLYDYVDKTRNFWTFESDVVMLGVVTDGIYVGTLDGVWWVSGPTFDKMKRQKVMDSPVIPGSMVDIPAEIANPPQIGMDADTPLKIAVSFLTTNGFCVAQDGGQAYNLTEAKFIFPFTESAAAMFQRQDGINKYVAVCDSGGTPVTTARIGDFVEAELIRAVEKDDRS